MRNNNRVGQAEDLSFQKLFQLAEEKYDRFQFQEAEHLYSLAYTKNPEDHLLVICYANILKENGKHQLAEQILQQSIHSDPHGCYKRYFELAEIHSGMQSIKTYELGIEVGLLRLQKSMEETKNHIKRDLAKAYAGIAEVCLTDLLQQAKAEKKCQEALQKGKKMDQNCMDVNLQMCNYLLFKDEEAEAEKFLDEISQVVSSEEEELQTELILQTAKYYIELQKYLKSLALLTHLHEQVSSQLQVLYLLSFCHFKLRQYSTCQEYINQYQSARKQAQELDQEVEQAMVEMKQQLKKVIKEESKSEDEWMDVEDAEQLQEDQTLQ